MHDADPNNDGLWHDARAPRVTGIQPIQPGDCFIYEYALGEPGPHLFFSRGAPSGGQGDGDGFAINYGASGMGSILLANRKGFGPAQDCLECVYEEFFLQSWVNGDLALLVNYEDDPANVHHSYLGDRVEFRNLHAGPKETHIFHLHAHRWLAHQDDPAKAENFGTYLDSQTIAPQQGFAYNIFYGGSGNRNQTVGDSIFHCHLYPHFAQGIWALWRVHDVFEDGSRCLPDGQDGPGTDTFTGELLVDAEGKATGTLIPAIVPLLKQAMPPFRPMPPMSAKKTPCPAIPSTFPAAPVTAHRSRLWTSPRTITVTGWMAACRATSSATAGRGSSAS